MKRYTHRELKFVFWRRWLGKIPNFNSRCVYFLLFILLAGCASKSATSDDLISIQILDRNGFSETISAKDRLKNYEQADFTAPQPYQKVVRIFGKPNLGKTSSIITTYHSNGQTWQYLEIENGRAHGQFIEWHPNGVNKLEATVIAGTPDLGEAAQMTWLFDGDSHVYDEQGHLIASIPYNKGLLDGPSRHYYANGKLLKEIPYERDEIHGIVRLMNEEGTCVEKIGYSHGEKHGTAIAYWTPAQFKYREVSDNGHLMKAEYFNPQGEKVAGIENGEGNQAVFENGKLTSLLEYHKGVVDGAVQHFNSQGQLTAILSIKDGAKNGEEWEYYSSNEKKPKLYLQWNDDVIEGVAKTWYENGVMESQREMHDNKKHGLSFAWFKEGDLMFMEEYENDQLIKGSYFKKWEKNPISKIENGKGVATLFDQDGKFLKKITYDKGLPQNDF
ncbi:MAG TPA: hypothetical protein PKW79_03180 [Rhabdochlamydiaceae bacterium]|nr:hypothetical protein [Rhabdochlamydiaceae bacterium]